MDWHPVISVQQQTLDNDLSFQHFKSTFCILGIFFENRKYSGHTPGQNDDPVSRWPGRERWPKWPIDPVAQWPSSMSAVRLSLRPSVTSRLCRNDWANLANFQHGGFLPPIPHCVQENLDISNNYDTSFWNFVPNRSGLKNFATASRSRTRRRRRPSSLTTPIRQSTSHGHGCLLQVDQL